MVTLNLTATGREQEMVKAYLEEHASETLAGKINDGVRIEKDGKTLVSKKDLNGFMKHACDEAHKQAEQGAQSACVDDSAVYGWAVHYFEEDGIEGVLYNEDGTEYKPKPVVRERSAAPAYTPPVPKPKPQMSMFDLGGAPARETEPEEADGETEDGQDGEPEESEPMAEPQSNGQNKPKEPEIHSAMETGDGEPEKPALNDAAVSPDTDSGETETLTQIGETEYVDQDGVVYELAEHKENADDTEQSALFKIFGDTLVVR
jgi:hypothetical protein